jgi:hypothetical protein
MVRTASIVSAVFVTLATAASAAAQAPGRPERSDLRTQIYVMEGALARAVMFGAQQVNREIRSVSPELFSLAGDAQARGVYLDGYGVFFDVGVPVLRQSMLWSFRFFDDERTLRDTISVLRRQLAGVRDAGERRDLELTIQSLELRLPNTPRSADPQAKPAGGVTGQMVTPEAAPPAPSTAPGGAAGGAPSPAAVSSEARRVLKDPNRAYTDSVQRALIDAMIDYSAPMRLSETDWLTVAARDNEPRDTFAPQDPYEEVVTILLRIKGSDLAAYRAGTIDREEAKRRVEIREF